MGKKRIVLVGDAHAGHRVGICSPKYQSAITGQAYHRIQVELWDHYQKTIESLKPIDILVHNGDAIDGDGGRSGGSELLTTDVNKQIEMAYEALAIAEAGSYCLSYGTPYHTGVTFDAEKILADKLGAVIKSHLWLNVNGVVFDIKHKIGGSGIPHGKGTPISKEWLWNHIWAAHEEQPKADILIRSHVHNFFACMGADWLGMTLPALQGQGSKYGARQCSGEVHFGLVWFDVYDNGDYTWNKSILRAASQRQECLVY